jgi:hypothetical protein
MVAPPSRLDASGVEQGDQTVADIGRGQCVTVGDPSLALTEQGAHCTVDT